MTNYKLQELKENTILQETFNIVITNNLYDLHWHEIIEYLESFFQHHESLSQTNNFKKHFISQKDFDILNLLGLDYNHIDASGNNFLHYVLEFKNSYSREEGFKFFGDSIDYIFSKTNNIQHINNSGKHILFYYLSYLNGGLEGESFFQILEKYPEFNGLLNQMDKSGKNLLNYSLSTNATIEITNFLLKKNISIHHLDSRNLNLLSSFIFIGFSSLQKPQFDKLLMQLDITNNNKFKNHCLDSWMDFYIHDNVHVETKSISRKWLNYTLDKISKKEFFYNEKISNNLFKYLEKKQNNFLRMVEKLEHKSEFLKTQSYYQNALTTLASLKLEYLLPNKEISSSKLKL